jgi:hypothetical protein
MYPDETLSVQVRFRLTPSEHHKLLQRARRERRTVANLCYLLVSEGLQQAESELPEPHLNPVSVQHSTKPLSHLQALTEAETSL